MPSAVSDARAHPMKPARQAFKTVKSTLFRVRQS